MQSMINIAKLMLGVALLAGGVTAQAAGSKGSVLHRVRDAQTAAPTAGSIATQTPVITNHGGPIMVTPNVYVIWYGNWNQTNGSDNATGQQIVRDFLSGLNNSAHYLINSSYTASNGSPTGGITFAGEYTDTGSQGTRLTDARVQTIVSAAISGGHFPKDTNGIYVVLTSSNVSESSGFCNKYCGWHTNGTIAGADIKYAFVGNANRCLTSCSAQSTGPNGNAGIDGALSVIAHELEETTTDPDLNGFYDSKGAENGDKCAWTFGANQTKLPSGAYYNLTLPTQAGTGTRNYLIQRNLDANSLCYVDYVKKTQ